MHAAESSNLLTIPLKDIDGKEMTLAAYKAEVVLVVNVASACGYTSQYEGLEALYRKYKAKGLVIVGVPCNDFGGQEPGTESEIKKFCSSRFQVTFPLTSKVSVKGKAAHPLFVAFTGKEAGHPGPVSWNFNKFLVGKDGKLLARFDSSVAPESSELQAAIEKALK
ncbi:MAG: glutathione peroxidase [Opitutales bacterium]|nr:glutathione peroxidase [Opitutales bacterium]